MIDFSDPLTVLAVFVPIIGGIIASVYYIDKITQDRKDRQIKIHVEKVLESDHRIRKIRVRYMNKPIEKCSVSFNGTPLIWDSTEAQFKFTIFEGGQRNATIPDDIFTEDAEIVIKSDEKVLKRINFKDLELGR